MDAVLISPSPPNPTPAHLPLHTIIDAKRQLTPLSILLLNSFWWGECSLGTQNKRDKSTLVKVQATKEAYKEIIMHSAVSTLIGAFTVPA